MSSTHGGANGVLDSERRRVGQCTTCRHARRVVSSRGSAFWMCRRAATDPAYLKYPPLPVHSCAGHEPPAPSAQES